MASFSGTGYVQHWIVLKNSGVASLTREVFFSCGAFCYAGRADVGQQHPLVLADVPTLARRLDAQKEMLSLLGETEDLSDDTPWAEPRQRLLDTLDWLAEELAGEPAGGARTIFC